MKHASLLAAAAVVLLANAIALIHAQRNRSGQADAEITLTDRELNYHRDSDDSGVALTLRWLDARTIYYAGTPAERGAIYFPGPPENAEASAWLDRSKLEDLGFDCSVAPEDPKAESFYAKQIPRTGFAALEYDGPAWRSWFESGRQAAQVEVRGPGQKSALDYARRLASRLAAIDAAPNAAALRDRHPDRSRVLIVPVVIRIFSFPALPAAGGRQARPARLTGYIKEIPPLIHVSRPFSERFRALRQTSRDETREEPLYRVRLRYGTLLEPWVIGADFAEQ